MDTDYGQSQHTVPSLEERRTVKLPRWSGSIADGVPMRWCMNRGHGGFTSKRCTGLQPASQLALWGVPC